MQEHGGCPLSHGLDHGGDICGRGTLGTWMDVTSPTCTGFSASFTELHLAMTKSAPGPSSWNSQTSRVGSNPSPHRNRVGMAESQVSEGTHIRQQAQPETSGKYSYRRTEGISKNEPSKERELEEYK